MNPLNLGANRHCTHRGHHSCVSNFFLTMQTEKKLKEKGCKLNYCKTWAMQLQGKCIHIIQCDFKKCLQWWRRIKEKIYSSQLILACFFYCVCCIQPQFISLSLVHTRNAKVRKLFLVPLYWMPLNKYYCKYTQSQFTAWGLIMLLRTGHMIQLHLMI